MNTKLFSFLIIMLGFTILIRAEGDKKEWKKLSKVQTEPTPIRTLLNINSISTVLKNDGISDIDKDEQASGLIFPKGSGKTACYQTGLLWGGKAPGDPQVRVGGCFYSSGLWGGRIINSGVPYDQLQSTSREDPLNRIYRVRPDVYPGGPDADLSSEINGNEGSAEQIRAQYELDWNEWPAQYGAPFDDKNGNGIYEPTIDVPGVPGADQTVWSVANDLNPGNTSDLYGTLPMGFEQQVTYWSYNKTGALGNMFFRKYIIINKSNVTYDSMYVAVMSDVDLGNATDDYSGCDTTLGLGYTYNASAVDATYSPLPPPAIGFDFFEGPLVKGMAGEDKNKNGVDDAEDYGLRGGKRIGPGWINLPMTSFYYFARGDATVTDPTRKAASGATEMYNFFQGRIGKTGEFFVTPPELGARQTTYALSGDPLTRNGWIDGMLLPSGDRRQGQGSGPFTMAPSDTQEVVVAEICAGAIPGVDRLSAIGLLKFYDKSAQDAFDNNFDLPTAPPPPEVNIPGTYDSEAKVYYALDKKIILDWGENPAKVRETENFESKGYKFEGYNVYQLPNAAATVGEGVRVATYDVANNVLKIEGQYFDVSTGVVATKVQQFGNDSGIRRYLEITSDALKSGVPLVNGIRYYFAVTAYAYNGNVTITNLENPIKILTIIPTSNAPGVQYEYAYSDTIQGVIHTPLPADGGSDGNVFPLVVDPTKLTGMKYTVSFDSLNGGVVWNVIREDGVKVLTNQTNQNADAESPVADGIQFRVIGAPLDVKAFDMTSNGAGPVTETVGYDITSAPTDKPAYSADWYRDVALGNATITDLPNGMQVGGGWFFIVAGGPTIGDHTSAIGRWTRDGTEFKYLIPNNYEMRFTQRGGKAFLYYTDGKLIDVPFELWYLGPNLDNPNDDVRMMPFLNDDNENDIFDFKLDHEASGSNNDPYSDWIYWFMPEANPAPGEAAYEACVARCSDPTYEPTVEVEQLSRVVLMNWNEYMSGGETAQPETGTTFRIRFTVPNKVGTDQFEFTAPKPTSNINMAKEEINRINVFPNPYYGVNSEELNKYNRFVTFTHLPGNAIIRIFNLAGILVRTINKDNNSTYQRWDLANDSGLPVASGLYIAYIDMPVLGKTKILKVAIIQEQQILDRF